MSKNIYFAYCSEKDYPLARTIYAKVLDMKGASKWHKDTAQKRLKKIKW